jgi:hypothetical protein
MTATYNEAISNVAAEVRRECKVLGLSSPVTEQLVKAVEDLKQDED